MTEFISTYNLTGALIGLCTFLVIGIFHPLVIKGEYYLGQKSKWIFAICGVITLALCIYITDTFASTILGVTSFSCFWSIKEVAEQKERVRKGWFPANPKRSTKIIQEENTED